MASNVIRTSDCDSLSNYRNAIESNYSIVLREYDFIFKCEEHIGEYLDALFYANDRFQLLFFRHELDGEEWIGVGSVNAINTISSIYYSKEWHDIAEFSKSKDIVEYNQSFIQTIYDDIVNFFK